MKILKQSIKEWPSEDRPREKLFKRGEHTLSDSELIAILLRSGVKGESAIDLARKIVKKFKTFRKMSSADLSTWKEFKGLGIAKIAQLKAAIEIGRRFKEEELRESNLCVRSAGDVAEILMPRMRDLKKEIFKVVSLNSRNRVIDILEITEGTVNQANPIIREIFQKAMQCFSSAIVCVHNHPSGDANPSRADKEFTRKLVTAGDVLQIKVFDHVIIGNETYFSLADAGII
ncbi:MAG: JAB domain-containing protein [PVC group bacterium]|nr:JAB domain-containing protein [PVC group bacterium]